ncbi:LLM class F420-dependent oxidoreductase, partial [Streptomyces olivaceoviridis]
YVDTDGLTAQRTQLDTWARAAGRKPQDIDTVLRVNISTGTGVRAAAEAIRTVNHRTGIEHFMVDTMYEADTVEDSLTYARELLALLPAQ